MTSSVYKQQATRLQSFLQRNPGKASELATAKHSTCLEAVAAIHGARNWNTLNATSPASPENSFSGVAANMRNADWPISHDDEGGLAPTGPFEPAFGGLVGPGKVLHQVDPERFRSTYVNKLDLVDALGKGYYVTVLSASSDLRSFVQGMGGESVSASRVAGTTRALTAPVTHLDFQGWLLPTLFGEPARSEQTPYKIYWSHLQEVLKYRTGAGFLLLVKDIERMSRLGSNFEAILSYVEFAHKQGTAVVLHADSTQDLNLLQGRLPADQLEARAQVARENSVSEA